MEEYQEKQKNKKRKTSFIDDSELEGLSDDVVIIDKKKEEEI